MADKATKIDKADPALKKAYIRTLGGSMVHLFTNVVFTTDPKKVEIDGFVQAQLDAGKLVIETDTDE